MNQKNPLPKKMNKPTKNRSDWTKNLSKKIRSSFGIKARQPPLPPQIPLALWRRYISEHFKWKFGYEQLFQNS